MSKMYKKKTKIVNEPETTSGNAELLGMIIALRDEVKINPTATQSQNKLARCTEELCKRLLKVEKKNFIAIAMRLPRESFSDPVADVEANVYLSVCEAVNTLNSLDWAEVKRYVMGKFKNEVTSEVKRIRKSDKSKENEKQEEEGQEDRTVLVKSYNPDEDYYLDFVEEVTVERSQRMLDFLKEMRTLFNAPSSVFPVNFDYTHEYTASDIKRSNKKDIAFDKRDIGLSHDILYNKLADGTKIVDTAWHVTGNILGALVNAGRMLGKCNFSSAERKLLSHFAPAPLGSPDYELALVQLEYCEELLSGVLLNHETGKYRLQDSDPLTELQVYELLGIIRQAMKRYPDEYHEKIWNSIDDGVEDGTFGFLPKNLRPLQDLFEIAVNTALGFCNTGISLLSINEDIMRASVAHKNEDFDVVEALYQKNINRLHGFMVSYVIQYRGANLPNTSLKRKSAKGSSKTEYEMVDTTLRGKLRLAVRESLCGKADIPRWLLKRYAE